MFLSANADFFFAVSIVFDDFSFGTYIFELSFKLGAFVNPNFFWVFCFDYFLKAWVVFLAYLVFRGFTHGRQSTATYKFCTARLYLANLST